MRDLLISMFLVGMIPWALKRPMVAVLMFGVISIMSPHRYTWGFAYSFPWAVTYAVVMTLSVLVHRGNGLMPAVRLYWLPLMFFAWTGVTTFFALDSTASAGRFTEVLKVQYAVLLALVCMRTGREAVALMLLVAGSLGLYALKGFAFMLRTGGTFRVAGAPDTSLADNNSMALALIIIIPLLYWIAGQLTNRKAKAVVWITLAGAVFSAIGSYSRGAFLALGVVGAFMFVRSHRKWPMVMAVVPIGLLALGFMPQQFWERMSTISSYNADASAVGRLVAWETAFNVANARLTGGGFSFYLVPENFWRFSPPDAFVRAAHSIYFQVLGDHGWIGLLLFLLVIAQVMFRMQREIWHERRALRAGSSTSSSRLELFQALQLSLIAYLAGGAFLSVAYWDITWYLVGLGLFLASRRDLKVELPELPRRASRRPAPRPAFGRTSVPPA